MGVDINGGIFVKPIGVVRSEYVSLEEPPAPGLVSGIELFSGYERALLRMEEHSHFWVLSWFHKARREVLTTVHRRIDPDLPEYGVFGLRSPNRPNPIALSLVRLERVDGGVLHVKGLDAVDGTPVLDIKPYVENDIVFSAATPYFRPARHEARKNMLLKEAVRHHGEECPCLLTAVRMVMAAVDVMGHRSSPGLKVEVTGPLCLADTIQGLTRARLANPPRFSFREAEDIFVSIWRKGGQLLKIAAARPVTREEFDNAGDESIFVITGNL
ncbi:MAG: tRNA (N6-threonylcarbamoyladenosine(37)-N6)-methyltransferase TrmO [Bacillota bacterium]